MNGDRRLLHETAEVVLALMQGLAAFRDRHDLVHAALIAARQAPEAGAPKYPDAPPDNEARVRECAARMCAVESDYSLDQWQAHAAKWTHTRRELKEARAALAYADETHANATRRAANRIGGLEMGCAELRTELATARAINSALIRDRDAARLRVAPLERVNRGWQERDRGGAVSAEDLANLIRRASIAYCSKHAIIPISPDEAEYIATAVNELIVWALDVPN